MTREVLLGIDVGTTLCKAAVVTTDGTEAAHGVEPTPWRTVPTGAEIDPIDLAAAALAAARSALAAAPEGRVSAIGVTSMAETGVLLDEGGKPVCRAIAWHDSRGQDEAARLVAELGAERFTAHTGLPATPLASLVKYRWLRDHDPGAARGARWLSVAEWIVRALGGDEVAEASLASRTGFLEIAPRGWWAEGLEWAGAPRDLLPEVVPAGGPVGRVDRERFREATDAVLAVAGHDHLAASVGAGATRDGDVFDSCGTAEAFVRAVEPPVSPEQVARAVAGGVTVGWHVWGGRQALLGGFLAGLQRFLDLLGVAEGERAGLDEAAIRAGQGAGGVTVHGIAGEKATLSGIRWDVAPGLVWRAALEAVAREGARVLATIESVAGPTQRLVVTGGWARDAAFRAVKEAMLGTFEQPRVAEAGARGAALLAGCAAGIYDGVDDLPPPTG
jgi:sugar (pentulose or hexulose) kinase